MVAVRHGRFAPKRLRSLHPPSRSGGGGPRVAWWWGAAAVLRVHIPIEDMQDDPMRVLITGATGFLGRVLTPALTEAGYTVRAATRTPQIVPEAAEGVIVGDLRVSTNLSAALAGVDAVVHLAGLENVPPGADEAAYRGNNLVSTQRLAESAARAGVGRFVFLSSVRAQSGPSSPVTVTEALPPAPVDAYGRSKLEAEQSIAASGVPAVILRPVLVHGPGVRLNMASLMRLALMPWPLPLGAFHARRSILARPHLVDAVLFALKEPAMSGQVYLVADPEPLSVAEMVSVIRQALGRRPNLLPVPLPLMRRAAGLLGRTNEFARATEPMIVDPAKLLAAGWQPRLSTRDALAESARLGERRRRSDREIPDINN
jgi:nucleoside-diphosphate-sugar epimerase